MNLIIKYSWEIFIAIEILSILALLTFGIVRYFFDKRKLSLIFIFSFLSLLIIEALLGLYIYLKTGEISTIQIVILIFVLYACTFGVFDFLKLDRWMKKKIGSMRGKDLLSDKDKAIIKKNNDPKYIAKKYRISSVIHLIVFVIVQGIFWSLGTDSFAEIKMYLSDFSWIDAGISENSPYPNDVIFGIGVVWGIVFIIDFIYSWSYTIWPKKVK